MNVKGFFLVMASLLAVQAAFAAQWITDYSAGLASARQRNCAVFLFFTGSDWCGYCQALDREILSTPSDRPPNEFSQSLLPLESNFITQKSQSP